VIATFNSADAGGTMGATIDAAAGKAKGLCKAQAAERVAWASLGTDESANPYTLEYRQWLEMRAASEAADEGGDA
jgi:hypothetical protein